MAASREIGRADSGRLDCCFVLVVVPAHGAAADKGETLSTAGWPAGLCSLSSGAVDTPAGSLMRGSLGNPRSAVLVLRSALDGALFILNAQGLLESATQRTLRKRPFTTARRDRCYTNSAETDRMKQTGSN